MEKDVSDLGYISGESTFDTVLYGGKGAYAGLVVNYVDKRFRFELRFRPDNFQKFWIQEDEVEDLPKVFVSANENEGLSTEHYTIADDELYLFKDTYPSNRVLGCLFPLKHDIKEIDGVVSLFLVGDGIEMSAPVTDFSKLVDYVWGIEGHDLEEDDSDNVPLVLWNYIFSGEIFKVFVKQNLQ